MTVLEVSNEIQVSIVEVTALNLSSNIEETLYYSTLSYITEPGDTPGNTAYHSRLLKPLSSTRALEAGSGASTGKIASVGFGNIELSNIDGALDVLDTDYALVGRAITVKSGDRDGGHANLDTIFTGTISNVSFTQKSLNLSVQDSTSTLDVEVSSRVYTEPGGVGEPTFNTALHGNYLPICFGDVYNISPPYVGKILEGDVDTATLDPYTSGAFTFSNNNLTVVNNDPGTYASAYSTISISSGKYYVEFQTTISASAGTYVGIATSISRPINSAIGSSSNSWGYYSDTGELYNNNVGAAFGSTYTNTTAVIGVAIDADVGLAWFSVNNVWQNSGNPSEGTNPAITGLSGNIFVGTSSNTSSNSTTARFDPSDLTGSVPSGFNAGAAVPVVVAELVYQVHDGPITDITNVYANGAVLNPSEYTKYLDTGRFQINIGSVSGATITADVQGDSTIVPYNSAVSILKHVLESRLSPAAPIDSAKFDALSDPYFESTSIIDTASSGVYYRTGQKAASIISDINKSFGLFSGFNRSGVFDIGVFLEPNPAESSAAISSEYILDVSRETPRAPFSAYTLGYKRNYTVMTESTIAPVVVETLPDQYTFLVSKQGQQEVGTSELGIRKSDSVVEPIPLGAEGLYWDFLHRYPLATAAEPIRTVIQDPGSALLEARRRWRLYNSGEDLRQRTTLSIKAKLRIDQLQVNDTIHVVYSRFGLESGGYFRVTGFKEDLNTNLVVLEVWG